MFHPHLRYCLSFFGTFLLYTLQMPFFEISLDFFIFLVNRLVSGDELRLAVSARVRMLSEKASEGDEIRMYMSQV
jgi:hypothetical protein